MAYVAISAGLVNDIDSNINRMMWNEIRTIGECPKVSYTGEEPWFLEAVWGNNLHLKSQMPPGWLTDGEMNLRINVPTDTNPSNQEPLELAKRVSVKYPPRYSTYRAVEVPKDEPGAQAAREWWASKYEIINRWQKVETQVKQFIRSCKSLNEALKLWPDFAHYVDKHYIDKVNTKVERIKSESEAAKVIAEVDVDLAMASLVSARMAQSA